MVFCSPCFLKKCPFGLMHEGDLAGRRLQAVEELLTSPCLLRSEATKISLEGRLEGTPRGAAETGALALGIPRRAQDDIADVVVRMSLQFGVQ